MTNTNNPTFQDELARLAQEHDTAAMHNVSIVGDPHGAVLDYIRAVDEYFHVRLTADHLVTMAARDAVDIARARFTIADTTAPTHATASPDEHEVGA